MTQEKWRRGDTGIVQIFILQMGKWRVRHTYFCPYPQEMANRKNSNLEKKGEKIPKNRKKSQEVVSQMNCLRSLRDCVMSEKF